MKDSFLDLRQQVNEDVELKNPEENFAQSELGQDMLFVVNEYIEPVLELEGNLEEIKTALAMKRDFSLASAFNLFSRTLQAKVTLEDFLYGLDRLGIAQQPMDVSLMYRRFDSDTDGRLGFWEFSNAILPVDERYRDEVEQR